MTIKEMTLPNRFRFVILIVVLFMIASVVFSIVGFFVMRNNFDEFYNIQYETSKYQMEIRKDVQTINKRILWVVLSNDNDIAQAQEDNFVDRFDKIERYIDVIISHLDDVELEKILIDNFSIFESETYITLDMMNKYEKEFIADYVRTDFNDISEILADTLEIVGKQADDAAYTKYSNSMETTIVVTVLLVFFSICSIIIAVIMWKRLSDSVVLPLKEIEVATSKISEGNLHISIEYNSPDEIGLVANSLRTSIRELLSYIEDIDLVMSKMANKEFDIIFTKEYVGDFKNIQLSLAKFADIMSMNMDRIMMQQEYIQYQADHDPLTELPNRRKFYEVLKNTMKLNQSCAVIFLDLDNFKSINDTLGHIFGDKVLIEVANGLRDIENEKTFISRFGGDEFIIILMDVMDVYEITGVVYALQKMFEEQRTIERISVDIAFSIGISRYPEDTLDIEQLLMYADLALHSVKLNGKNEFKFFDLMMDRDIHRKVRIRESLSSALQNDGFKLVYQPQVDTHTGKTISYEALLRLSDNSYGPGEFIEIAEENGQIIEIGRWVTEEVVRQLAKWRKEGMDLRPVSLNFSAGQLRDNYYLTLLEDLMGQYDIEPKFIELEVTESILISQEESTREFFRKIQLLGIRISMDDFGTGYSSLTYMTFLPVYKIKLDKSLCDKFLNDEDIEIMRNIISLFHSLNLITVAEGIERHDAIRYLQDIKCDLIQGYFFSKPVDPTVISSNQLNDFKDKL